MSRLFELKSHTYEGDVATLIDLDKVCWLQIEKKPGQHYPHLVVRFVDGHECHDLMIDQSAYQLVEAYRSHLGGSDENPIAASVSGPARAHETGLNERMAARANHAIAGAPKVARPLHSGAISSVHN